MDSTDFCTNGHQPLDYADFQRRVVGLRSWPGTDLEVGECRTCRSTISYALPAMARDLDLPVIWWDELESTYMSCHRGVVVEVNKTKTLAAICVALDRSDSSAFSDETWDGAIRALGQDWGWSPVVLVGRYQPKRTIMTQHMRQVEPITTPDCYERPRVLKHDVTAELDRLEAHALAGAA